MKKESEKYTTIRLKEETQENNEIYYNRKPTK